ncbi:hypothetical protein [Devosia sp. A449]
MQPASAPVLLSTRSSLAALEAALELFRGLRVEMPIQVPLVFLMIAQRKGIRAAELCKRTGLSQSAISRNITMLTKEGKAGEPGPGLVVKTLDPVNTRAHAMHLTKGRVMAARLAEAIGKSVRPRKAMPVEAAGEAVAPLEKAKDAFAGAHWEVWAD